MALTLQVKKSLLGTLDSQNGVPDKNFVGQKRMDPCLAETLKTMALIFVKMQSYQNRNSHCKDKIILELSYLHNRISYTGKMTSL